MAQHTQANDWEIALICQMGGAEGVGGGIFFADIKSKKAKTRSAFLFLGGSFGFGGSFGGGAGPSPLDVVQNHVPDMYTPIKCAVRFSVDDLDCASGRITNMGVAAAYGYSCVRISAGQWPVLFTNINCNGWGTGVGYGAATTVGMWKQLGDAATYDTEVASYVGDVNYNGEEMSYWQNMANA